MKNYFRQIWLALALLVLISSGHEEAIAQKVQETGGTSFWLAMPKCNRASTEGALGTHGSIVELFITAKTRTQVRVMKSNGSLIGNPVIVEENSFKVIGLNVDQIEHKTSCKVEEKGILVESDDPISVVVYVGFSWTGEAYRVIPTDWLGTEYYTLNLHNDACRMASDAMGSVTDHPNQILIVATEDDTRVEYVPKYHIKNGARAGETGTIELNRGQSVLLMTETSPGMRQQEVSDLSGSKIKSNKKIAVFSGHTKGSYPLFAETYYHGLKADFLRNMLFDSMWPTELLGKEYVTVPFIYHDRPEYQGLIEGEKGDIVRIVATKNNTIIKEVLETGEESDVTVLRAGQVFDMNNKIRETPCVLKSNFPILVGQYGKGYMWWSSGKIVDKLGNETDKEENELQNPSKTGQGLLIAVTPTEQWSNYASFLAVSKVNNHFNLIFRTEAADSINYIGSNRVKSLISEKFLGLVKKIPGTPYSFIREKFSPGLHTFEALNPKTTFACYTYGDLDSYKSGYSYGYPTSSNFFLPCNDTIFINEDKSCFEINGTVTVDDLQEEPKCAILGSLSFIASSRVNATFQPNFVPGSKTASFKIIFRDKTQEGKITVRAMTKSGNQITKEYTYFPEILTPDITVHNFGVLVPNKATTKDIEVTNNGKVPVHVKKFYLKIGEEQFSITTTPVGGFTIAPGEKKIVTVQALMTNSSQNNIADQLWVETDCRDFKLVDIRAGSGAPDVYTTDINFGVIPITVGPATRTSEFTIENSGNNPSTITGYTRALNLANFTCTDLDQYSETNPLILEPKQKIKVNVTYDHKNESGITHTDTLRLTSTNTSKTKLYSVWKAQPIKGALTVTSYDWQKQRVIDNYVTSKNLPDKYDGKVTISNNGTNDVQITDIKAYQAGTDNEIAWTEFMYSKTRLEELKSKTLVKDASEELPVFFIPKKQMPYEVDIIVYGKYNDVPVQSNKGNLMGKGVQPHSYTENVDFGVLNLDKPTEKSRTQNVYFVATNKAVGFDKELVITGLTMQEDKFFKIAPTFTMPTEAKPVKLQVGDTLTVPVTFTPTEYVIGGYKDVLSIVSDVNINPAPEDFQDVISSTLTGNALSTNVASTDLDFGTQYINLTYGSDKTKYITFKNNSSEGTSLYLTNTINQLFAQANPAGSAFSIKEIWIDNPTNVKTEFDIIELLPGQTLFIAFEFSPKEVINYTSKMNFSYSLNKDNVEYAKAVSTIIGSGKEYLSVVEIAKGYEAKPGDFANLPNKGSDYLEVKYYKAKGETKPMSDAKISHINLTVVFGDDVKDKITKHFYPISVKNGASRDYTSAIITDGTMTQGWEVMGVEVNVPTNELNIKLSGKKSGKVLEEGHNNTLVKIKLLGYLATTNDVIPFKPTMKSDAVTSNYLKITPVDGDGKILEVCLDDQRMIETTGGKFKVSDPTPNPVVNNTVINYSTPIETPVLIEVFNLAGAKVATLVNEMKKPGNYDVKVDVNALGLSSGKYSYRVEMGPYSTVKQLVITK